MRLSFISPPWIWIYFYLGFFPSPVSPEGHLDPFILSLGIPIFFIGFEDVRKKSCGFWRLKWSRNLLLLAAMQVHRDGLKPKPCFFFFFLSLGPYNLGNLDSLAAHQFGNPFASTPEAEGDVTHFPITTTSGSWRQISAQFLGQQVRCL